MLGRSLIFASVITASFVGTAARAAVFDFTFANGTDSGSGQFIATGTGPIYTVTGVSGFVDGSAIMGISLYGHADELLSFPPGEPTDIGGIAFSTAVDTYNVYAFTGGPWLIKESVSPTGLDPTEGTPVTQFSVTAAGVPEPATWAMFLAGFGALGFMMRGLRRNGAIAAA